MRSKPWYLFLIGIIFQAILLVLVLSYPKAELIPGGEEWTIYLMMIFLFLTTPMSLVILLFSKLKISSVTSIILGLFIGIIIAVFAQSISGTSGIVFLIGGIAIGLLFISIGIISWRDELKIKQEEMTWSCEECGTD